MIEFDDVKYRVFARPNIYTDPKIPTNVLESKVMTSINDSFIGQPEFDLNSRDLGTTNPTKYFGNG